MEQASQARRTLYRRDTPALHITLLAVPVLEMLDAADHPEAAEEDLARARVVRDVVRPARAVREVRHAAVAADEPVRDPRRGRARDRVARSNGVILSCRQAALLHDRRRPELERAAPFEDDEDLLFLGVAMRRRAGLPRAEA